MKKKYIEDRTAALFLPISFIILLCTGPGSAPWLALSMGIAAWALQGTVGKKGAPLWMAVVLLSCLSAAVTGESLLAGELMMMASGVLLWQSLGPEGRRRAKLWCLRATIFIAVYVIAGCFAVKTGRLENNVPDISLPLLFALAALSDVSSRRRFLFCIALGMTGSPLGLICLGTGLLFKKQDWASDSVWTVLGLTWLVFPWPEVWLLFAVFAFWCIPETIAFLGRGTDWHFLPFLVAVWNPWALLMLGDWALRMELLVTGAEVLGSGLTTVWTGSGFLCALALLACSLLFIRKPAGYVWVIGFLFGSWYPALFLLGAGTGMADLSEDERTEGKLFYQTVLIVALALSLWNTPFIKG